MKVLILGGTGEGRSLASELVALGIPVVSSLAGRVSSPRLPVGEVRIGGFGGVAGLAEYLARESISAVVDATHPFAAGITANATQACRDNANSNATDTAPWEVSDLRPVPLLLLRRPAWHPEPGDTWTPVPDIASAATALGELDPTSILLTTGRQETAAFAPLPHRFVLRAVEPPDGPLPAHCEIILDRGPFTLSSERALFAEHNIRKLVTKNSGGPMTAAKLTVAREHGLEVLMVERPPLPEGPPIAADVAQAVNWVTHLPA